MTYDPKYNAQNYKYRSEKFKRVGVDFDKEYYETVLKPIADSQEMKVGTFIKSAIDKEIKRLKRKSK